MKSPDLTSQSLRRWYLLVFVAAVLGTTLLLGLFLGSAYRQTQKTVEVSLSNITQVVEVSIEGTLRRIQNDLELISHGLPDAALEQSNVIGFS
jgi:hypothetical protein